MCHVLAAIHSEPQSTLWVLTRVIISTLALCASLSLAISPSNDPKPIRVVEPTESPGWRSMDVAGDLDRDGLPDLVLGNCGDDARGENTGAVVVVSGSDFRVLLESKGAASGEFFGHRVWGVGDVDGDGVPDVAGTFGDASRNPQSIRLLSGKTGAEIPRTLGKCLDICPLGDVDGDAAGDVLLTTDSPFRSSAGSSGPSWGALEARSGRSGKILYSIKGSSADDEIVGPIRSLGDLDGDGSNEFLSRRRSKGLVPRSGRTGSEVLDQEGLPFSERLLGWEGGGPAGDNDGDGTPDFAVYRKDDNFQVEVRSGRDAKVLRTFEDRSGFWISVSIIQVGDLDACGHPDLALACPGFVATEGEHQQDRGRVILVSGGKGKLFGSLQGEGALSYFGSQIVSLGDINGDRIPEFACTEQIWIDRMEKSAHVAKIYSGADLRAAAKGK